jgi:hypothetical protein
MLHSGRFQPFSQTRLEGLVRNKHSSFSRIFVKKFIPLGSALHFVQDHVQIMFVFKMLLLSFKLYPERFKEYINSYEFM